MRNMSSCESQISVEEATDQLHAFLKTASDAGTPVAAAAPLREPRNNTAEALWGQEDGQAPSLPAQHHSNAVLEERRRGREAFLKRHFESYGAARAQAEAQLGQSFDHVSSGDYESSNTDGKSKRTLPVTETMFQKTKRLLG